MLRTTIFLYVPNFGFICILQAKNIANKEFIPDYSLDPGLKLLESVPSKKNSWICFSRRLPKSSNLHISVHFKLFAGQLQIERWHDLVRDEDNSSSMGGKYWLTIHPMNVQLIFLLKPARTDGGGYFRAALRAPLPDCRLVV